MADLPKAFSRCRPLGVSPPSAISLQRSPSHGRPAHGAGSGGEQGWVAGAAQLLGSGLWQGAELPVRPPSSSHLFPGLTPATMDRTNLPRLPGRQAAHSGWASATALFCFPGMVMSSRDWDTRSRAVL